jgi:hypothetical protein
MKVNDAQPFQLPLPAWVLHPFTALLIALMHVYLAAGHLLKLFGGEVTWTNIWKGFGALGGAYVFAALASRGLVRRKQQQLQRAH